jgi:nitrite reductase (NADH) large subunit
VTLVHLMDRLMERQLDAPAAELLKSLVERKGIEILLNANTARIHGETRVEGVELTDGRRIDADAVIFAAGIRPNIALAKTPAFAVNRGIVVDDHLQTGARISSRSANAPSIAASATAWSSRPMSRRACWRGISPARRAYGGSVVATNLKVSGVSVFSAGDFIGADGTETIVLNDLRHGTYKKLVISDGRLTGAVLIGDVGDALWYLELIRSGSRRKNSRRHDVRPLARDPSEAA